MDQGDTDRVEQHRVDVDHLAGDAGLQKFDAHGEQGARGDRTDQGAERGHGELAARHREQDAKRGQQAKTLTDAAGRFLGAQREIRPDTGEGPQIGGAHPGNVQRTQGDPGDEGEVRGEENTPCHTDPDRGTVAA